jgi:hypothetical protein
MVAGFDVDLATRATELLTALNAEIYTFDLIPVIGTEEEMTFSAALFQLAHTRRLKIFSATAGVVLKWHNIEKKVEMEFFSVGSTTMFQNNIIII